MQKHLGSIIGIFYWHNFENFRALSCTPNGVVGVLQSARCRTCAAAGKLACVELLYHMACACECSTQPAGMSFVTGDDEAGTDATASKKGDRSLSKNLSIILFLEH